jgi:hypothetical protein
MLCLYYYIVHFFFLAISDLGFDDLLIIPMLCLYYYIVHFFFLAISDLGFDDMFIFQEQERRRKEEYKKRCVVVRDG